MRLLGIKVALYCLLLAAAAVFAYSRVERSTIALREAHLAYLKKNYDLAFQLYSVAAKKVSFSETADRRFLEVALREKKYDAALEILRLWKHARDRDILRAEAGISDHLGDYWHAIDIYQRDLSTTRSQRFTHLHYIDLLLRVRQLEKASDELGRYLRSAPKDIEGRRLLVQLCAWQERFDCAFDELAQLEKLGAPSQQTLLLKAQVFSWGKQFDKSALVYEQLLNSLRSTPDHPEGTTP